VKKKARGSLLEDGRRLAIYPADVRGRFARARNLTFAVLIGIYVALPWIRIGGHPAVFLDVEARRFYLFGATFNAQDGWMMAVLLLGTGLGLLFLTALLGRVWCGWACPQTVFLEALYRRVERWLLGPREKRLRRAAAPWSAGWLARNLAVHAIYAAISLALAHVLLSYFVSLPRLWEMIGDGPRRHLDAFALVMVTSGLLYANFAWFREQLCVVVCPYGRLQSVLVDQDSLIVGYDARRGEPRGKAGRAGAGDCVDCGRCVAVCPTGIDIREGLQMDCIACTACVDACDEIMDKLGRARGLIRYDSQSGLRGEKRRVARPRVLAYGALLAVAAIVGSFALRGRSDFEANLLRAVGAPFVLEGGEVRNSFNIHLVNKRNQPASFDISAEPADGVAVALPLAHLTLDSLADRNAPVVVRVARDKYRPGMRVSLRIARDEEVRLVSAPVLGPVVR
jgi:cytochrome c oxidase accessory protein FixG